LFLKEFLVLLQSNLTEIILSVHKIYGILLVVMLLCLGCEWHMRSEKTTDSGALIERYDRMESFFLTTGDFSALQQMQTLYPMQTRRLIEDVLQLGKVDDAHINTRFFVFFQDSTLQSLLAEVGRQYEDMSDVNEKLSVAFEHLKDFIPQIEIPIVYTQIGSLDQSIVVGDGLLGISLDKYLGADYPLYLKYGYSERQRSMMTRDYIVPDCMAFYLLSLYPLPADSLRDIHMGRIQYVVNRILNHEFFENDYVKQAQRQMHNDKELSFSRLLEKK
jgi:hypothetical protein